MLDKKEEDSSADVPPHPLRPTETREEASSPLLEPRREQDLKTPREQGWGKLSTYQWERTQSGHFAHLQGSCQDRTNPSSKIKTSCLRQQTPKTRYPNSTDPAGAMATGLRARSCSPGATLHLVRASAALPARMKRGQQRGLAGRRFALKPSGRASSYTPCPRPLVP